jgi:hypothetical protein
MLRQTMRHLSNDNHKDQIEEQLEEGHPAIALSVLEPCWRLPETPESRIAGHGGTLATPLLGHRYCDPKRFFN